MICRQCGACCIAFEIREHILGFSGVKSAGVRCPQLTSENKCAIHGTNTQPRVCQRHYPRKKLCGISFDEAMKNITAAELRFQAEEEYIRMECPISALLHIETKETSAAEPTGLLCSPRHGGVERMSETREKKMRDARGGLPTPNELRQMNDEDIRAIWNALKDETITDDWPEPYPIIIDYLHNVSSEIDIRKLKAPVSSLTGGWTLGR